MSEETIFKAPKRLEDWDSIPLIEFSKEDKTE